MQHIMTGSRHLMTGIIVAGVALAAVALGIVQAAWSHLDGVMRPWQRGIAVTKTENNRDDVAALREEALRVGAENTVLRKRLEEYQAIRGEGRDPHQVVVARGRIIARTIRAGRRYVELDVGGCDGVLMGQPVCLGWNLVGTVAGLHDNRCLVQLITDSASRIPVKIMHNQAMVAEGVALGTGRRAELHIAMVEDKPEFSVPIGAAIVTLGVPKLMPSGLLVGTVASAALSPRESHWQISVTPLHTTDAAESVVVLRADERGSSP